MKLLITGGAGFIGSAVVRQLMDENIHDVLVLDALTYAGNLESIPGYDTHPRVTFSQTDLRDAEAVMEVVLAFQPDVIMHLAAESHVDRSIEGPREFLETNVMGTFNLLQAALELYGKLNEPNRMQFRFHHVSTDEVYGDLHGTDDLFTETTPYAPSSPYSASKAASDHLVRAWNRTYGLPTLLTNCSNNYGPYHFTDRLMPHILLTALARKHRTMYGERAEVRDCLSVDGLARPYNAAALYGKGGETYNNGGHN